ncbi:PWWP domain-containing protein 3-like [Vicia villosa]|uniref:PWWP domain-containing protein 3-like n=1 Tax=Vicia villosa TaxID=3911 RepID=UPI00273B402C|nr:PWWP domain-containing protein 3-like [Vicia villosa]
MGMVETESKEPCGVSSSVAENVIVEVDGSEKVEDEVKGGLGSLKSGKENGAGEKGLSDDGVVVVEVVKSSVFETEVSVLKENDSQVVADSEMNNGVSSVLKTGESDGGVVDEKFDSEGKDEEGKKDEGFDEKIETIEVPIVAISENINSEEGKKDGNSDDIVNFEVPIVETNENIDVGIDDLVDEKYDYSVGDFVWGKIKSHPWWPGRVYNPSDASDFALKLKQKNRLLVAYFGDGTFAWCHPSQLKPFKENFDDMVKQSSTKSFTYAVQEAVDEVGTVLVKKMSSLFVAAGETESEFAPLLANNAGIKEGVFVPESGIERLSAVAIEPAELLSQVKQIAEVVDIASVLELEILKAQLSAFYFSRGGYKLACYEDPKRVIGLEDKDDVDNAVEAPSQGPFEEDFSNLPLSPKSGELRPSPGLSGSRSNRRRKQKSIADIMGEDNDADAKDKEDDVSDDEVLDAIRSRGRKKRKDSDDAVTPKPARKRKELIIETDGKFEMARKESSESKKKSENGKSRRLKKKKEEAVDNEEISDEGNEKENDEGMSEEQSKKGFLSRERKKSKYLSPPFTTSITLMRGKVKPEARSAGPLSPRLSKCNGKALQELELSDSLNDQTQEDEKKTIDPEKVKVPSAEILSKIRNVAVSPQISREGASAAKLEDFIYVMRSSLYREGSLHKAYNKSRRGRKRSKPESELDQSAHVTPIEDSEPAKKRKKTATSISEGKKKARETETGGKKEIDEKSLPAVLFVSFWPGSTLPTTSDLVAVYQKFGALNEEETNMFLTNYTGRVSFLRTCDAEKALSESQKKNPFEPSEVTFQLQYVSSDGSKSGAQHTERSKKSKPSQDKKEDKTPTQKKDKTPTKKKDKTPTQKKDTTPTPTIQSLSDGNEASKLNFIKEKLQGLVSMLESSDDKTPDFKTKIESEVKGLLEEVNKMVESTSS